MRSGQPGEDPLRQHVDGRMVRDRRGGARVAQGAHKVAVAPDAVEEPAERDLEVGVGGVGVKGEGRLLVLPQPFGDGPADEVVQGGVVLVEGGPSHIGPSTHLGNGDAPGRAGTQQVDDGTGQGPSGLRDALGRVHCHRLAR